jgi:glycosyltransferase involved in cell wall biosynthesis
MKVLIINKDLSLGGGTTVIKDLQRGLGKFGIEVDIAIFENNIDLDSINKAKIIVLSKQNKITDILRPLYFFAFLFRLMIISPKYDLIFTFERYPSYFNVILSRLFNKKSVIYVINPLMESLKNINKNRLLLNLHVYLHKIVFSLADLIVVLERNAKKNIILHWSVPSKKIAIIPNFIDFKEIESLSRNKLNAKTKEIFAKNKVIINIGRLHSQKNQSLLIKAFALIRKRFKNVVLLIIGSGGNGKILKKLIKQLGIGDHVFIFEKESNPFKYLSRSDIFILSSKFEGFGLVLLESLYFGLPLVSTDCSYGIRQVIAPELSDGYKIVNAYKNDYGIIVNDKNKQTVARITDSIGYYLNNKINIHMRVLKRYRALNFSKEKILPIWASTLRDLLSKI